MRYVFDINWVELLKSAPEYTYDDGARLTHIYHICMSRGHDRIDEARQLINEDLYTWINIGSMVNNLPQLTNKSHASSVRAIQKYVEDGFVKKIYHYQDRIFLLPTSKMEKLFEVKIKNLKRKI